jgi:hypothetical protein
MVVMAPEEEAEDGAVEVEAVEAEAEEEEGEEIQLLRGKTL